MTSGLFTSSIGMTWLWLVYCSKQETVCKSGSSIHLVLLNFRVSTVAYLLEYHHYRSPRIFETQYN